MISKILAVIVAVIEFIAKLRDAKRQADARDAANARNDVERDSVREPGRVQDDDGFKRD